MRLFYSPFHSLIHKVLVTVHEVGLWDDITFVPKDLRSNAVLLCWQVT